MENQQGAFVFFIQNVDSQNDFTIAKEKHLGELVLEWFAGNKVYYR